MNAATQNRLFAEDGVTTEPVISVRGLRTAFGDHVVHDNLDLTVFRGEIMVLVGGSGTGKTVLLRQIIGLERPAAGSVRVLGQSCSSSRRPSGGACRTAGACCSRPERCSRRCRCTTMWPCRCANCAPFPKIWCTTW